MRCAEKAAMTRKSMTDVELGMTFPTRNTHNCYVNDNNKVQRFGAFSHPFDGKFFRIGGGDSGRGLGVPGMITTPGSFSVPGVTGAVGSIDWLSGLWQKLRTEAGISCAVGG